MITLPKTVSPKTASERLDLSFGIFARRGEKYSCYTSVLKFVPPAGGVCGAATHAVGGDADYGLLHLGFKGLCHPQVVCGVATHAVGGDAGYGLLAYCVSVASG